MIGMSISDGGLSLNLKAAPSVTALQVQRFVTDVVNHLVGAVQKNIGSGGLIGRRTGDLARAMMATVEAFPAGAVGEVFPDPAKVAYGSIQEDGGTIVPKNAQMLAIPLAAMLTGNGVARGSALQVAQSPGAFGFSSTFIPKGHHVIFGVPEGAPRGGRGAGAQSLIGLSHLGTVVPLFALVRSVTLPGLHYMATTFTQETSWIAARLEELTGDVVQVTFGEASA